MRLIQDFEDGLFTSTPCDVLEKEDERLLGCTGRQKENGGKEQDRGAMSKEKKEEYDNDKRI